MKILKNLFSSTCMSYFIISFTINMIVWISHGVNNSRMLHIWANLLILLFCFVICSILYYKKKKFEFSFNFFFLTSLLYTILSLFLNCLQYIIKKENFWNGYTLLLVLLFSVVLSFCMKKCNFKDYFISAIFYFFMLGIFYYIFFVVKTGYKNNLMIVSLGVYVFVYIIFAVTFYFINKKKLKRDNNQKKYESLYT